MKEKKFKIIGDIFTFKLKTFYKDIDESLVAIKEKISSLKSSFSSEHARITFDVHVYSPDEIILSDQNLEEQK
ncbi:hypothetical protein A3D54_01200 [Candidatus Falkowbacteria bacterium RIFCSPHIGHO2_02_FULL_45_15]|uniref:Uncharacterized protein n=1 Tax=Candidatus Falkowbacteria bacterium RIFCSPHIGHO2_02_FULL_45_15 TaxID=1797987 RepID=A0A1F5RN78_9BACT|nr:MAG: hypothetical protein A3D54_01200 [Candidatus Falkowbacteria bacterium RIFCSPHIGHO2_02_FULL_45_15]